MKDFILNLYASPNFPLYLGIIIGILIIIFIVIYFIGKKDQKKIEMTQRIDQIVPDAFKEVSTEVKVEVPAQMENIQATPVIEPAPVMEPVAPVTPIIETPVPPVIPTPVEPAISTPIVEDIPVVENPIPAPNVDVSEQSLKDYTELLNSIEEELNKLENKVIPKAEVIPNVVQENPIMPQAPVNIESDNNIKPVELLETSINHPVEEVPSIPTADYNEVKISEEKASNFSSMMGIELPKLKEVQVKEEPLEEVKPILSEITEETLKF